MDSVIVRDLAVETHVGATDAERAVPQTVLVSFEVTADLSEASRTDDLEQTVDYGTLVPAVARLVESSDCKLLEKLAGDIASLIERIPGVSGVTVEIAKASPPLEEEVGRVAVRIERHSA